MSRWSHPTVFIALLLAGTVACQGPSETPDSQGIDIMEAPPEERAMAVLMGLFTGGIKTEYEAEHVDEYALLDLLVSTAYAGGDFDNCTRIGEASWVSMSLQGQSGTYGSGVDGRAVSADADFCQNAAGDSMPNNSDDKKFKAFSAGGMLLSCSWGEDYNLSGAGIMHHLTEDSLEVFGGFGVTGGPGSGNYDCSFYGAGNSQQGSHVNETVSSGSCTDDLGNSWTEFDQINVGGSCTLTLGNANVDPPTAVCGEDGSGFALDTVSFDGSASIDPYGRPLTYTWALARPDGSSANFDDLTSATPSVMMDLVGDYVGTLTVTTVDGATDTCDQSFSALSFENFRIEMWWDNADDMDLHLLEANDGSGNSGAPRTQGDCYYANCDTSKYWVTPPDWGVPSVSTDDPGLDLDDIWGLGPENINIDDPALSPYDGWYEIFVHDYPWTARYYGANAVHVNIYLNGNIVRSYDFSMTGEDADYYVAKIHWPSGTIINCNGLGGCP
jgi:hypothetical protein